MCTFQAQTSLEQSKDLVEVAAALVRLYDRWELLGVDDDVETANLCLLVALMETRSLSLYYVPSGTPTSPSKLRVPVSIP